MLSRRCLCALVLFRLCTDLATPLMPGAFRFDGEASVEACREHSRAGEQAGPPAAPTGAPFPPARPRETAGRPRRSVGTLWRWGAALARSTCDSRPEVAEDPPAARSAA